jgi:hypothetical protein
MSEHTLYIRRTKGGHEMPPVSVEELLTLIEAGGVAGDDELKVVGMRNFPSDESWAPVRDYPEVSRFFGATGRAQVKIEVEKANKTKVYAACALIFCVLAAFFFWWNPYVDAKDSAGEVVRLKQKLEDSNRYLAEMGTRLKTEAESAERRRKAHEDQLAKLKDQLAAKKKELDAALSKGDLDARITSTLATSDRSLRAEVSKLKTRIEQLNEVPKFWPGAEALQAPESQGEVRLVSTLPHNGYLYVIGPSAFPVGTVLELDQPGLFGVRVFARVVNSYPHAGGGQGASLHVPDPQEEDVAKIRKLKIGEILKCSPSSGAK